MRQYPAERCFPNLSLADMFVSIHAPAQRNLRIIHMKHRHILQPNRALNQFQRRLQTALAPNVISRRKQMRRVQTSPHFQPSQRRNNLAHFLQSRPKGRSHPRRILHQNPHRARRQTFSRLLDRFNRHSHTLLRPGISVRPRMYNQKVRTQRHSPYQLVVKRLNRPRAQHRLRRRQINQVIRMND